MERIDDALHAPGLVVVAGAVLAFVVSIANFALGQVGLGLAAAIGGLLSFGAGLAWLAMERRRVREAERQRPFDHQQRPERPER
ncbi:LapA family protein [Mycobacterium ostraviense]|nr:LapA family protein [Mycobacterium ostraviense]UGT94314.1 LapA family protein [Mycobacterium ostraviense]